MKAWQVERLGEPRDVLKLASTPRPIPSDTQLLVRVLAATANFPDVLMCRGLYQVRPELPFTPGIEVCGEVVEVPAGTTNFRPGDRVIGTPETSSGGGYAEFAVLSADRAFLAPDSLDDAEASSLYVSYQTGHFGLHRRAQIRPGETLLVHAAAGGVGSAAVQLAKAAGAVVIGVVGGAAKAAAATGFGADVVVDRHEEDFVEAVKHHTQGRGADVIYDPVGGQTFERSTKCVAFEGRLVVLGFASGVIPSLSVGHALIKNYSILGLHWGLYHDRDPEAVHRVQTELTDLVELGLIRPHVSERLTFDEVPLGVQKLADGNVVGRLSFVL
jgi:NADPH2:quinone reductase